MVNVLLATPGMEEVTDDIRYLLDKHSKKDDTPQFETCGMVLKKFANGEYESDIKETVRGATVFLVHPMQLPNPNDCLVNLLLLCDNLMRAHVGGITLVLPYMSYMRQDRRKDNARVPISARAIANLIESNSKVKQVITMDLHSDQEVGFFNIPVDNIPGTRVLVEDLMHRHDNNVSNIVVVSPDVGSAARVRRIARWIKAALAIIDKDRKGPGDSKVMAIMGEDVAGKHAVLFDDLIDTGGTILSAAYALMEAGAKSVEIRATHGLFCGDAIAKFAKANIPVYVTPSIPRTEEFRKEHADWLHYVSFAEMFANVIYENSLPRGSASKLYA